MERGKFDAGGAVALALAVAPARRHPVAVASLLLRRRATTAVAPLGPLCLTPPLPAPG